MTLSALERITNLQRSPVPFLKQRRFAAALLPKDVRQKPELKDFVAQTLQLAACSLTAVEQQFGYDAMHPQLISGAVEHSLPATYHNGTHTRLMMMRDSLAYARMRRLYDGDSAIPDRDLILLVLAASLHDAIQGNGRGTDERLSAELAVELMRCNDYPYTEEDQEKVRHAVLATAFNPLTKQQSVTMERPYPHMQEALAIGDLLTLCRSEGPVYAVAHTPESLIAAQGGYKQIFVERAARANFPIAGKDVRQLLSFIDHDEVLAEVFGNLLQDQANFFQGHSYHDPRVDEWFPMRLANTNFLRFKLLPDYQAGVLTALGAYDLAIERAQILSAGAQSSN